MNSINNLLPPEGYDWEVPHMSDTHSQGHAGPSNTVVQSGALGINPFGSFRPGTGNTQSTFQHDGHHFATEDVIMEEQAATPQENFPGPSDSPRRRSARRSRNGNADLQSYKEELKRLYLIENKSLKAVMAYMNRKYSLPESAKRYKEQFDAWGWRKNLPGEYAQWMAQKAHKRKREDGKDTVFIYGGGEWDKGAAEKSAARSKKTRKGTETIVVDTPSEINYRTPGSVVMTPQNAMSPPEIPGKGKQREQASSESEDEENDLNLSWRGHSRDQLIAVFESARSHAEKQSSEAEELFSTALDGYAYLLGPTHEEAVKVSFAMASFYTEQDRSTDADRVLEDVCRCHISKFGIEDRHTQQLILQVVEVLNGWNRGTDALAFLARSKDLVESESGITTSGRKKPRGRGKRVRTRKIVPDNELLEIAEDIVSTKSSARIDYGIGVARTHVAANDVAAEAFLQAIIQHCESDPIALEIQNLKARSEQRIQSVSQLVIS